MIYTKKLSVSGEYAKKGVDYNHGDILMILNEGQKVTGNFGEQDVFRVKTKNGEKNLTFNQTSLNNIIDAFGPDAKNWVHKEVKVWLILQSVSGEMKRVTYLTAADWILDESDDNIRFISQKQVKEVKEVQLDDINKEIAGENLPF